MTLCRPAAGVVPEGGDPRVAPVARHPAPSPARLSAPRSPARAFREGEGYDFVLFAANHRLPSRRGGLAEPRDGSVSKAGLLQTTPFARQAAPYACQRPPSRARWVRTR